MLPSWDCISQPCSSLEWDPWKDFLSSPVKADVAELCGEEQSHRHKKRPKWQLASTLLEKEPRFHFSVGWILNVSGLFNPTKCFFMVRQMKVKFFVAKLLLRDFFGLKGFFLLGFGFFLSLLPHGRFFISKEKYPRHSLCIMSVTPGNLPLIMPLKVNKNYKNKTSWVFLQWSYLKL